MIINNYNFELKNIKHSEFASQETNCYQATLHIDGKPFANVSNDGHGGCDNTYRDERSPISADKFWDEYKQINNNLGEHTFEMGGVNHTTQRTIELVCGDLLTQWLIDRGIKKNLRKICYVKDGGVYTLQAKHKPTPDNIEAVKKCAWWDKNNIVLNGKSVEECRQYFK